MRSRLHLASFCHLDWSYFRKWLFHKRQVASRLDAWMQCNPTLKSWTPRLLQPHNIIPSWTRHHHHHRHHRHPHVSFLANPEHLNVRFAGNRIPWCAYNPPYLSPIGKAADPTIHLFHSILGTSIFLPRARSWCILRVCQHCKERRRNKKKAHARTLSYVRRCSTADRPSWVRLHPSGRLSLDSPHDSCKQGGHSI